MSHPDARLVAALIELHEQLNPIIEEILEGLFDQEERRAFATVLATIAAELDPGVLVKPQAEKLPPGPPMPRARFSNSGP